MARFALNFILPASFLCLSGFAQDMSRQPENGFNCTLSFQVYYMPKDDLEPENPEKGTRDTPERLPASITESGVTIERVSESEIESYDIYTPSGIFLGCFESGEEFATSLFSLKGEYELRFTTSEYVYVGYVWME